VRLIPTLLFAAAPLFAALTGPLAVEGGRVLGVPGTTPSIAVFRGIPFAAPPVGDLRWRAPRPVIPWQGVRKADKFGTSCVQKTVDELKPWTYEFMTHNEVGEDCLSLNVWTPAARAGEKLPVYVYIYGGANTSGSGAVPLYDGEGLARKGIVVVTVNYRVGILGFFTHPELTAESGVNASGNYALLDLIAGLKWVRANIAAFGGDPGRVTIGGQSAGASNTHSLVASPLAKGLFHGAIAQSGSSVGGLGLMNARTLADQEKNGVRFAESKGAHSLADLRKLTWQQLSEGQQGSWSVVVDGYVQPAPAGEIIAQGRQNDVPTLTGSTADESGASPHPAVTLDAFQKQARTRYGDLADEFLKLYPATTDAEAAAAQNAAARDSARVSTWLWAQARAKTAKTKVFTYYWEHAMPGPEVDVYGAFHSSELAYVFDSLAMAPKRPFTATDRAIAAKMSSYWANFIRSGDPNGKGLAAWPSVGERQETTMELGDRDQAIPIAGSPEKLAFHQKLLTRPRAAR
jgi:para-nitrobenzyl esterase